MLSALEVSIGIHKKNPLRGYSTWVVVRVFQHRAPFT